jgi:HPr kinase/phosphorylase
MQGSSSDHATAILAGPRAMLIRGPSGAGKSLLAWRLLDAARTGRLAFARLVADDRVAITVVNGRLIAAAPHKIAGLLELRGEGILRVPYEPMAIVGLVVDLAARDGARMPEASAATVDLLGVRLPRLPVAEGVDPLPLVIQRLEAVSITR